MKEIYVTPQLTFVAIELRNVLSDSEDELPFNPKSSKQMAKEDLEIGGFEV